VLEMRPGCEHCDVDLPPESSTALICSFECTFCQHCATEVLAGVCPNCGGALSARPARATALLAKFPATRERTYRPTDPSAGSGVMADQRVLMRRP